jgi:hypothetical protein
MEPLEIAKIITSNINSNNGLNLEILNEHYTSLYQYPKEDSKETETEGITPQISTQSPQCTTK